MHEVLNALITSTIDTFGKTLRKLQLGQLTFDRMTRGARGTILSWSERQITTLQLTHFFSILVSLPIDRIYCQPISPVPMLIHATGMYRLEISNLFHESVRYPLACHELDIIPTPLSSSSQFANSFTFPHQAVCYLDNPANF
jgi:hypothetical protein